MHIDIWQVLRVCQAVQYTTTLYSEKVIKILFNFELKNPTVIRNNNWSFENWKCEKYITKSTCFIDL